MGHFENRAHEACFNIGSSRRPQKLWLGKSRTWQAGTTGETSMRTRARLCNSVLKASSLCRHILSCLLPLSPGSLKAGSVFYFPGARACLSGPPRVATWVHVDVQQRSHEALAWGGEGRMRGLTFFSCSV